MMAINKTNEAIMMKQKLNFIFLVTTAFWFQMCAFGANEPFNGLDMGLGNLSRISKAKTRSISPENFTGEKGKAGMSTNGAAQGAARDLGQGWKVSASAAHTISMSRVITRNSPRPIAACLKSSALMVCTNPSSASVFTAGTSWTRSVSRKISK